MKATLFNFGFIDGKWVNYIKTPFLFPKEVLPNIGVTQTPIDGGFALYWMGEQDIKNHFFETTWRAPHEELQRRIQKHRDAVEAFNSDELIAFIEGKGAKIGGKSLQVVCTNATPSKWDVSESIFGDVRLQTPTDVKDVLGKDTIVSHWDWFIHIMQLICI